MAKALDKSPRVDSNTAVAERLRLIRIAYGRMIGIDPKRELSQAELCRLCGIGQTLWNNAEKRAAGFGVSSAKKLRRCTGASLDYIYENDAKNMPHGLMRHIAELQAAQKRRA